MKRIFLTGLLITSLYYISSAQEDTVVRKVDISIKTENLSLLPADTVPAQVPDFKIYKLKPAVDIPITAIGTAWSLYAFTRIYDKDSSTTAQVLALNEKDLASYNRFGTDYYSADAAKMSDYFFYGSMPLPILFLADKKIRKDMGKVTFLYLEAMSITGLLYTGSTYFKDKYRPYAYNPEVPMSKRTRGGAKNSFYAGHVALVATSTFFMSKVYADYHPESNWKWLPYSIATISTGATAYLRGRGGEHFLSDIIIGVVQGTLTGILVPHFHKNKLIQNNNLSLIPMLGREKGLAMVYRF